MASFAPLQKIPSVHKAIRLSGVISGCLVAMVSIMLPACYGGLKDKVLKICTFWSVQQKERIKITVKVPLFLDNE